MEKQRYECRYDGMRFFGSTEEEALKKRDEYIRAKEGGKNAEAKETAVETKERRKI